MLPQLLASSSIIDYITVGASASSFFTNIYVSAVNVVAVIGSHVTVIQL
jgi:hypothetical protein